MLKLLLIMLTLAVVYLALGVLILHIRDTIRMKFRQRDLRKQRTKFLKTRLAR